MTTPPKPTEWSRGNVRLIRGDCMDLMKEIPDDSADMVLCDLPYGTTACAWDTVLPFEALWSEYRRICKPSSAIVLTCSQPFTSALVMSNPRDFRYCWVWEKSVGTGFLDAKKKPLRCHEDVAVFYREQPTYNPQKWMGEKNHGCRPKLERAQSIFAGKYRQTPPDLSGMKYPRSVIPVENTSSSEREHPTQKPLALMEYFVRTYTDEGHVVLDNTMGSGTTGIACIRTGRAFIGIEKDEKHFAIAVDRIERELAQGALFPPTPAPSVTNGELFV